MQITKHYEFSDVLRLLLLPVDEICAWQRSPEDKIGLETNPLLILAFLLKSSHVDSDNFVVVIVILAPLLAA
jgi:hypothetical protein